MRDYIPHNDREFNRFFANIIRYVGKNCAGTPPEWNHIPPQDQDALNLAYIETP
jgi:hypothetical protein